MEGLVLLLLGLDHREIDAVEAVGGRPGLAVQDADMRGRIHRCTTEVLAQGVLVPEGHAKLEVRDVDDIGSGALGHIKVPPLALDLEGEASKAVRGTDGEDRLGTRHGDTESVGVREGRPVTVDGAPAGELLQDLDHAVCDILGLQLPAENFHLQLCLRVHLGQSDELLNPVPKRLWDERLHSLFIRWTCFVRFRSGPGGSFAPKNR